MPSFHRQWIGKRMRLRPPQFNVGVKRNLRVPMGDGVSLRTDHYFPKAAGKFPTILSRSPYYGGRWRRSDPPGLLDFFFAPFFAERGYHFVMQTTRGRFDSEGEFVPCSTEQEDGLATLDWITRQPWSDGSVGMWGSSYLGHAQWAVARHAPPSLKAIVPTITSADLSILLFPDGGMSDFPLLYVYAMDVGSKANSNTLTTLLEGNPSKMARVIGSAINHVPLVEADTVATGHAVPYFRDWLAHPPPAGPFWAKVDHHRHLAQVAAPAHIITGWYDFCLPGGLRDYTALRALGQAPYLTIGPFGHDAMAGIASVSLGLDWFDAHLKQDRSHLRVKPVRAFVIGAKKGAWREFDDFPPPAQATRFFLHSPRVLSTDAPVSEPSSDRYCYDPADPTPAMGNLAPFGPLAPVDNRKLEARPDVLTFTTSPLAGPIEIIGPVRLELFVQSSRPFTDFCGRLCDVYPDGRSINLCEGLLRMTPERGVGQPDGSRRIEIDLGATGKRFEPGHAIRLQVASSAHPRWVRNFGTGEPVGTATQMVRAEQVIFHDAAHPSAVVLPVTEGM